MTYFLLIDLISKHWSFSGCLYIIQQFQWHKAVLSTIKPHNRDYMITDDGVAVDEMIGGMWASEFSPRKREERTRNCADVAADVREEIVEKVFARLLSEERPKRLEDGRGWNAGGRGTQRRGVGVKEGRGGKYMVEVKEGSRETQRIGAKEAGRETQMVACPLARVHQIFCRKLLMIYFEETSDLNI